MLSHARRPSVIQHFTLCVMLFALALRALVPSGFMPDAGALRDGRLEMTFCTSAGDLKTITVDTHRDTAPASPTGDPSQHQSQTSDCPFGVLSSLPAMPALALAVVGSPVLFSIVQYVLRPAPRLAMPAQGPPLGSRAPPSHLV
jgi:hypothetical protein